jgi:RHS repeat-associated protein
VSSGSFTDPFGYGAQAGYYTDQETGLVLYSRRYYDPASDRWLTRDPASYLGGINLYGYVDNDPLGHLDPSGEDDPKAVAAAILSILQLTNGAVKENIINYGNALRNSYGDASFEMKQEAMNDLSNQISKAALSDPKNPDMPDPDLPSIAKADETEDLLKAVRPGISTTTEASTAGEAAGGGAIAAWGPFVIVAGVEALVELATYSPGHASGPFTAMGEWLGRGYNPVNGESDVPQIVGLPPRYCRRHRH